MKQSSSILECLLVSCMFYAYSLFCHNTNALVIPFEIHHCLCKTNISTFGKQYLKNTKRAVKVRKIIRNTYRWLKYCIKTALTLKLFVKKIFSETEKNEI